MVSVSEKRRNERRRCTVPVESREGGIFAESQTVDLSQGGAGLIIQNYVPVNTEMAVEIDLTPKGEPILALGEVKWVRQMPDMDAYRVGLSFKDIKRGSKAIFRKFFKIYS